jgi:hypothetical protein
MRDTKRVVEAIETSVDDLTLHARARAMIVTGCCGARMYAASSMTICPCCDRPIGTVKIEQERDLTHVRNLPVSRYVS